MRHDVDESNHGGDQDVHTVQSAAGEYLVRTPSRVISSRTGGHRPTQVVYADRVRADRGELRAAMAPRIEVNRTSLRCQNCADVMPVGTVELTPARMQSIREGRYICPSCWKADNICATCARPLRGNTTISARGRKVHSGGCPSK